jgi:hypothetical protein
MINIFVMRKKHVITYILDIAEFKPAPFGSLSNSTSWIKNGNHDQNP